MKLTDAFVTRLANMPSDKLNLFLANQQNEINFTKLMEKTADMWKQAEADNQLALVDKLSDLRDACFKFIIAQTKKEYVIA